MITIEYIGPLCSVNNRYYRNFSLTKKYREFKEVISWEAKIEMGGQKLFKGDLAGVLLIYYKGHEPDLDNSTKAILDSLEGIVYDNDKQIKRLLIEKVKAPQSGFNLTINYYEKE